MGYFEGQNFYNLMSDDEFAELVLQIQNLSIEEIEISDPENLAERLLYKIAPDKFIRQKVKQKLLNEVNEIKRRRTLYIHESTSFVALYKAVLEEERAARLEEERSNLEDLNNEQ